MDNENLGQDVVHPETDDLNQADKEAQLLSQFLMPKNAVAPEEKAPDNRQAEAEESDAEVKAEDKTEYYTAEEIASEGIEKLDPKKIPAELMPFYKSMLKDYTKKTMAVAEEKKRLAEEAKPKLPEDPPEVKAQKRAAELRKQFKDRYNTDYELWNEDHQVLMSELVAETKVSQDKQQTEFQSAVEKWSELQATVQSDPEILQFALHKVSALITNDETMRKGLNLSASLQKAIENPNLLQPKEVQDLHRWMQTEIKKEYYAQKAKPKETRATVLDNAGTPAPKIQKPLTAKDIQRLEPEQQARLLWERFGQK